MAGKDDKDKKGFSGLSDLVSDISKTNDQASASPIGGLKPPPIPKPAPPRPKEAVPHEPNRTPSLSPVAGPPTSRGEGGDSSGAKWIIGIIVAVVALIAWVSNNSEPNAPKEPYKPPTSSSQYNYTPSVPPTTSPPANRTRQTSNVQYEKPPVGQNNVLSVPQICWCLREDIRIEAMRNAADTEESVAKFNGLVDDYNSRCGSFKYREGTLDQAKRTVESHRSAIVSEAIEEVMQWGRSPSLALPTESAPTRPNYRDTREAQELLTALGYKPGPIDGDYGRFTSDAIKAFQKDMGLPQGGAIDGEILDLLRKAKAALKPIASTPAPAPPIQTNQAPVIDAPSASPSDPSYFTRGSSQDDVLRIQGRPSSVNKYSDHEVWSYGLSSIDISNRDRRVLEWSNISGNLKVKMNPGQNVTGGTYFTRGSHQDDVLRVQGTPSSINRYSDHEVWSYGLSSVDISNRDHCVLEWSNVSGNLKVTMSPGNNVTRDPYFTRGSHQDDVLRIQGTPYSINRYSDHEVWSYGLSSVDISNRDRRVLEWSNVSGNLNVKMNPGQNVTGSAYFTRGSHQDDVLRIQGTPSSINRYSDHEVWSYGLSSVDISTRTRQVVDWSNISRNLRVQ